MPRFFVESLIWQTWRCGLPTTLFGEHFVACHPKKNNQSLKPTKTRGCCPAVFLFATPFSRNPHTSGWTRCFLLVLRWNASWPGCSELKMLKKMRTLPLRTVKVFEHLPSWERSHIHPKRHFWVDDFPFPKVGYVSFLEGIYFGAFPSVFFLKVYTFEWWVSKIWINLNGQHVGFRCFSSYSSFWIAIRWVFLMIVPVTWSAFWPKFGWKRSLRSTEYLKILLASFNYIFMFIS